MTQPVTLDEKNPVHRAFTRIFDLSLAVIITGLLPTHAAELFLRAGADTTLMESYPLNNLGGEGFYNSGTIQNNACADPFRACRNRALIKFDIAGNIPPNARITSVFLVVDVLRAPPNDETDPNIFHNFHRLLRDWGEGDKTNNIAFPNGGLGEEATAGEANWFHRFAGTTNTWATPGGAAGIDYATNVSASVYLLGPGFSPYTIYPSPELTADIQFWLDHPAKNFGWMMKAEDEVRRWTAKRLMARENPLSNAPYLLISYIFRPVVMAAAAVLNHQSGLYTQTVSISNTNDTALPAVRVCVSGLTNGTTVFNASGTQDGMPFVQYNSPVASGETVSVTIEYYAPNRGIIPNPTLIGDAATAALPLDIPGAAQPVSRTSLLSDGSFLIDFSTISNRTYYVQYSPDTIQWQTAAPSVLGTGSTVQWIDNGPPKTDPAPQNADARFYRVLLVP